mgnify:CR=1 FL=1
MISQCRFYSALRMIVVAHRIENSDAGCAPGNIVLLSPNLIHSVEIFFLLDHPSALFLHQFKSA